ncbi:hypothetical protein BJX66DRAFT_317589, partial [Aspergillus keveii]
MDPTVSPERFFVFSPSQTTPSPKRKITPSSESSIPKRILLISPNRHILPQPLLAPSNFSQFVQGLFPPGGTVVETERPLLLQHGHPDPLPTNPETMEPSAVAPREIVFEFDFHTSPEKVHDQECQRLLLGAFPNADRVEFDDRILIFHFSQLPPRPWPRKIAGVPCYFTDKEDDFGPIVPLLRRRSRSRIALSNNLDLRGTETAVNLVFDLVKDFFLQAGIPITEIQFWGRLVVIVLEHEKNEEILSKVPRSVAQCNCFYIFEEDMGRPTAHSAFRARAATPNGDIDNSEYQHLRPGAIVSSGKNPIDDSELLTSSGILLKNNVGAQVMTVAAHGFPGLPMNGAVYHPNHTGRVIGEMVEEMRHTDVALVRLNDGVTFSNEPFQNTIVPGPSFKLAGLSRAAETKVGDDIFLDSPFSGFLEGTRLNHAFIRVPSDDPHIIEQQWIRCQWDYMGQGSSSAMVDGICGSAIWNKDHMVQGFFRYAPAAGLFVDSCLSVAADHLLDKGYSI